MSTPVVSKPRSYFFLADFLLAHTAFILAESLALAAVLILPLAFFTGFTDTLFPLTFAHLARAAAAILALLAALIFRCFFGAELAWAGAPRIWLSLVSKDAIWTLIPAARRNCCAVTLTIEFMESVGSNVERKSSSLTLRWCPNLGTYRQCYPLVGLIWF
jgi:hypothetical protein